MPTDYYVAFQKKVVDCSLVEAIIGRELREHKYGQNGEFFELPLKAAIQVIEIISRYVEKMTEEIEFTLQGGKAVA